MSKYLVVATVGVAHDRGQELAKLLNDAWGHDKWVPTVWPDKGGFGYGAMMGRTYVIPMAGSKPMYRGTFGPRGREGIPVWNLGRYYEDPIQCSRLLGRHVVVEHKAMFRCALENMDPSYRPRIRVRDFLDVYSR